MPLTLEVPVLRRTLVAEGTLEVAFGVPDSFSFVPGQYISITVHGLEERSMPEQFHDFSISSSPTTRGEVTVTFRLSESPFKKMLSTVPLGSQVTLEGPKGIFTLPETANPPQRFIAGGIGITPFRSMIRFAVETQTGHQIRLDYYNKTPEQAAYLDELTSYAQSGKAFTLNTHYGPFTGTELALLATSDEEYAIAGPPGFVHAARTFLEKQGISYDRIRTEEFSGYA